MLRSLHIEQAIFSFNKSISIVFTQQFLIWNIKPLINLERWIDMARDGQDIAIDAHIIYTQSTLAKFKFYRLRIICLTQIIDNGDCDAVGFTIVNIANISHILSVYRVAARLV